jgi:hypothetical protein
MGGGLAASLCLMPPQAMAQATQPRVVVSITPDSAGPVRAGQECPGCDGQFTAADALAGGADPLPPLAVTLRAADDAVLARAVTVPQSFGAQTATFVVAAPGSFSAEVALVPGWMSCPDQSLVRSVTAADFGADGAARLGVALWRGCAVPLPQAAAAGVAVTSGATPASPSMLAPSAVGLRMPQTGVAVQSSGRLMFGLAATAVTIGLLGLAYESGFVRRS